MLSHQTTPTNTANADPMDPIKFAKASLFLPFVTYANKINYEAVQMDLNLVKVDKIHRRHIVKVISVKKMIDLTKTEFKKMIDKMKAINEGPTSAKISRTNVSPTVSPPQDALETAHSSPRIGNKRSLRKIGSPIYYSTLKRYHKMIYLMKNEVARQYFEGDASICSQMVELLEKSRDRALVQLNASWKRIVESCKEKLQSKGHWDDSIDTNDLDDTVAKLARQYLAISKAVDLSSSGMSSD